MQLIRGLHNYQQHGACVATIGNFDGVHLGHAEIFTELNRLAKEYQVPSLVITFQPLPHEYFSPDTRSQRLQTFRDRVNSIASFGIDRLLMLPFNPALATQDASTFVNNVLVDQLQIKHLLVGDDFRFGKDRAGDIEMLQKMGKGQNFNVSLTPTVELDGSRVSSTRVRQLLSQFDCAGAAKLLGRPYRISGRISRGAQIGRTLGFPTANIGLKHLKPLLRGVYAVESVWNQQRFPSVANLGERPTVNGRQLLLEVHLLDQQLDLYGECVAVDFLKHIRAEKKFDSLDDLKQAIHTDSMTTRDFFSQSAE